MNHNQIYQQAIKPRQPVNEEEKQVELILDDNKAIMHEDWLKHPITKKILEFLVARRDFLTLKQLEAADSATKPDDLLRIGRLASKVNTYKEILNYATTGKNPD